MSLIAVVYVPTGIALSGDRPHYWDDFTASPQSSQSRYPDYRANQHSSVGRCGKDFLLYDRFGVGTFGDALVNNMPIAHHVEQFKAQFANNPPVPTNDLAVNLLGYFRNLHPVSRVGFLVIGYDGSDPKVVAVDVTANTTQLVNVDAATNQIQYGIIRGGDTAIVDRLLTVGGAIDTLVATSSGARFLAKNSLKPT